MALILLAEDESSTIDHVRSVLASQGWLVKTVKGRAQALRAASEFAPQLVLLNDELKGVDDLVRTFSRRSGGPGVVLLSAQGESVMDGIPQMLTGGISAESVGFWSARANAGKPSRGNRCGDELSVRVWNGPARRRCSRPARGLPAGCCEAVQPVRPVIRSSKPIHRGGATDPTLGARS